MKIRTLIVTVSTTAAAVAGAVSATSTSFATSTASAALPVAELTREAPVDFGSEVYPILRRNCLACHNTTKPKAGLNLESPEAILRGGDSGPAALAGRGGDSLMLKTAAHLEDPLMPPAGNKVNAINLTADELGLIKLWIDQGARDGSRPSADVPIVWRGYPQRAVPVTAAAISPSGALAAAARGNRVEVVELATGVSLGFLGDPELAKLELYQGAPVADRDTVMAVAFGSDELMATSGYRTARLWRRAPMRPERESLVLAEQVTALAARGSLAAAGDATGRVTVWDTVGEKPDPFELNDQSTAPVTSLAFSPDASLLVVAAADGTTRVCSVPDRRVAHQFASPVPVSALAFAGSGSLLGAAGTDGVLRIYDVSSDAAEVRWAPVREVRLGEKAPAVLTALNPDGPLLLWGNGDSILRVLNAATGENLREITCEHPGHAAIERTRRQLEAAKRHVEGRQARATAAGESAKKESDAARAAHELLEKARADWRRKVAAATAASDAVRHQPDDKGRQEASQKLSQEAQAAERSLINARTNAELGVRLAGQGLQSQIDAEAALVGAQTALAEIQAAHETAQKLPAFAPVKSAVVLGDGLGVILVVEGGRAQWHSLETGALLDSSEIAVSILALAGDRLLGVSADKKSVFLPARRRWQLDRVIGSPDDATILSDRVTALSFSSDSRLLATGGGIPSRSGEVKIWHVHDGSLALALVDPHSDTVNGLAISPEDSFIATAGSDRWAHVFKLSDGEKISSLEGHSAHVLSVAWRADGLALATGGADKSMRTWDWIEGRQLKNNASFGKEVSAVGWIGAGDMLASASGDATIRLNDDRLPDTGGFAYCLAADYAGSVLAAGGEDGVLRVWSLADKSLVRKFPPPIAEPPEKPSTGE